MAGKVVKTATQDTTRTQAVAKMINELESERSQKVALRDEYLKNGWLTRTRKYDRGLDQIREKLMAAHQMSAGLQSPQVIASGLGVLLLFRFLTMLANLICVHRLVEFLMGGPSRKARA